jgi:hypothetical protein
MTHVDNLPQGGQAQQAWAKPERSKTQRRVDVVRKLESDNKLWIATASPNGNAHLVPFSFVWDGEHVIMATRQDSSAARNAASTGNARVALGDFANVVLIDGRVTLVSQQAMDNAVADRLASVSGIDARHIPGFIYLQLLPTRIQAWWSNAAELASPTVMRDGRWLG